MNFLLIIVGVFIRNACDPFWIGGESPRLATALFSLAGSELMTSRYVACMESSKMNTILKQV
jgi:hypothetical protein